MMTWRRTTFRFLLAAGITAVLAVSNNWLQGRVHSGHDAQGVQSASAGSDDVEFDITDEPGRWFKNTDGAIGGTQSLAVVTPGSEVKFSGRSNTVHTVTSLLFPTGAGSGR